MYQILVADDNHFTRKAIVELMPWEDYGCQVCGQADNGLEAFEIIKNKRPQIALLDIKMPGLSGLEVVEKAKLENIDCIFIMITAYDDFQLIQRGLKAGVFDYVLKPVSDEEFKQVLQRAIGVIEKEKVRQKEIEELKVSNEVYSNKIEWQKKEILRKLLLDVINGSIYSAQEFGEIIKAERNFQHYFIMILSVPKDEKFSKKEYEKFLEHLEDCFLQCEMSFGINIVDVLSKEGIVLFVSFDHVLLEEEYRLCSIRTARKILEALQNFCEDCYIAISKTSKKTEEIGELYKQAVFAGNIRFFIADQNIIHYESIHNKGIQNEYVQTEKIENFFRICKESPNNIEAAVEDVIEQFTTNINLDIEYVKNIFIQVAIIMTCTFRQHIDNKDALKAIEEILKIYGSKNSIQDVANELRGYAKQMRVCMEEKTEVSHQTKRIMEFLNRNYAEHITLQDLSDYMGLSCAHICRILKNDTGETFVTLLNKIRIKRATRLLKSGEWKVYEVAAAVGYSNYAYFYQMFKKETGVSPKEYYKL